MKTHLQDLLRTALSRFLAEAGAAAGAEAGIEPALTPTKDPKFGDFQSNLALQLAKPLGRPPRAVAEALVRLLPPSDQLTRVEIAGPGFINLFVARSAFQAVVAEVLEQKENFGRDNSGTRGKVMVEFVSANPTGPMHVGHGRGAAYGDSICKLLGATGWTVWREYYVNDAGRQVDILAVSVWLRYLELLGQVLPWFPSRAYQAGYIAQTAVRLRDSGILGDSARVSAADLFARVSAEGVEPVPGETAEQTTERLKAQAERTLDEFIARLRELPGNAYRALRDFALTDQLEAIKATLAEFGVRFDRWYSERDLVESGLAEQRRAELIASGHTYEKDGALWFRTTEHGDDKDRVLVKADGAATYFGNDLAYHVDKLDRGWSQLIDVWGADHHGLLLRMRAAIESLTGRKDALRVQMIQFVTLSSGKMGKRSGNFVTLQDLLDEAGRDAVRFFYLMRSHDQHLEFDIDLARSRSNDNPVYYVQYAHARIQSVFAQLREKGGVYEQAQGLAALQRLDNAEEKALLSLLRRYPEMLRKAAAEYEPHTLVFFLKDLAEALHGYYNLHRFLLPDDAELQAARLALIAAVGQVLRNALEILGVSAPDKM